MGEREQAILEAYRDFRGALKHGEVSALEILNAAKGKLEAAQAELKTAADAVSSFPADGNVAERAKLELTRDEYLRRVQNEESRYQIAKDLSKMQILANVDEGDVGQIKEGQQVKFTVQSYPDRTFMGKVKQVRLLPTTVQNVVNYSVVVEVENPGNVLLPGMTATVDFITAKAEQVLKVPNGVLRFKATTKMMETFRKRLAQRRGENGAEKGGALRNGNNGRRGEGSPLGGSLNGNGMAKKINLLWYLDKKGELQATPVRLGATDGQMTEIRSDKIYEGMMVIKGVLEGESEGVTNPFQPTRRGPGPGPGGPPRGM